MSKPKYNFNAIPEPAWGATIASLSKAVNAYNKGKAKGEQISICWDLIKAIYSDFMKKYEAGETKQGHFYTTHTYLADPVKRHPRTIARQLLRLLDAGIVLSKKPDRNHFEGKDKEITCINISVNLKFVLFHYKALGPVESTLYQIADFLSTYDVLSYVESNLAELYKKFILFVKT